MLRSADTTHDVSLTNVPLSWKEIFSEFAIRVKFSSVPEKTAKENSQPGHFSANRFCRNGTIQICNILPHDHRAMYKYKVAMGNFSFVMTISIRMKNVAVDGDFVLNNFFLFLHTQKKKRKRCENSNHKSQKQLQRREDPNLRKRKNCTLKKRNSDIN